MPGEDEDGKVIRKRPFFIQGLIHYLGINPDTYWHHIKTEEFQGVGREIKNYAEMDLLERAVTGGGGRGNNVAFGLLKTNHGYIEEKDDRDLKMREKELDHKIESDNSQSNSLEDIATGVATMNDVAIKALNGEDNE